MKSFKYLAFFVGASAVIGCADSKPIEGLRLTPPGDGPVVDWDVSARPLPEIPFPNDIATWPDPSSPTGKRVNASMIGPTELESLVRRQLDRLDGFGTYSPLWVSFDRRLDIENIRARHADDNDFSDDAVYIINIDPDSPDYGKLAPIDMGWGNFPVAIEKTSWFANDYRPNGSNLLFETVDEEGTGVDSNYDGELTATNVYPPNGDPVDDLLTFYEMDTETLILQPLYPLREQTEYAVVITERLTGDDGTPVRSPFEYVNHGTQTASLSRLVRDGILEKNGLTVDDVAFAWSFTTQSTTADLVSIRKGLDGRGSFGWLEEAFPPDLSGIDPLKGDAGETTVYIVDGGYLHALLQDYAGELFGMKPEQIEILLDAVAHIDYLVAGTYESPNFLGNDEEIFQIDRREGTGKIGTTKVTFLLSVPKEANGFDAPFPTALISHGYTSNRLELILHAGTMARFGFAGLAIDAWGHGGGDIGIDKAALHYILDDYNLGPMVDNVIAKGRARDLNGDGKPDSGGDFWTADALHTRDVVRQTAVDNLQLVRILRSWDGSKRWPFDLNEDGQLDVAGDFNGDGTPDTGGPSNRIMMVGGSLGGIMSGIVPAVEPHIEQAVAVSGAGGLIQVALRTTQGGVNQAILLRVLGPLVITTPNEEGTVDLSFQLSDVNDDVTVKFADLDNLAPRDYIEVFNHKTGQYSFAYLDDQLRSRMNVQADAGDPLTITIYDGPIKSEDHVKHVISTFGERMTFQGHVYQPGDQLVSPASGHGVKRQTPRFRRFMSLVGMAVEPGDPISYSRHFFAEPLPILEDGPRTTNVLYIPTIGDTNVAVAAGVAMARAAGLMPTTADAAAGGSLSYGRPGVDYQAAGGFETYYDSKLDWEQFRAANGFGEDVTPNDVLVDNYVLEGIDKIHRFGDQDMLFDVEDLDQGLDAFNAPTLAEPLRLTMRTSSGISAIRIPFIDADGEHGFGAPSPFKQFDIDSMMHNMIGHWGRTRGLELVDDLCLEDYSCGFLPQPLPRHERPKDVPEGPAL